MDTGNKTIPETGPLIRGCIKADRNAQGQLYALMAPAMFVVCLRYSHNREDAEESLQEGFIRIFDCIHQFKGAGSFEGWARKIMVNCSLQRFRARPMLYAVPHNDINDTTLPAPEDITTALGAKELLQMIQQLPPACKMVFNLFVFEAMTHREIASLLDISEGTSKSNLSDARQKLQRMIAASWPAEANKINYL